jgi:hypothetical protein
LLPGWRQFEACKQGWPDQVRNPIHQNLVEIVINPSQSTKTTASIVLFQFFRNEILSDASRICLVLPRKRKTAFLPVFPSVVLVLIRLGDPLS